MQGDAVVVGDSDQVAESAWRIASRSDDAEIVIVRLKIEQVSSSQHKAERLMA